MKDSSGVLKAIASGILLALYAITLFWMIYQVITSEEPEHRVEFHGRITFIVNNVGGLLSAIVIARLAITRRGDNPVIVRRGDSGDVSRPGTCIAVAYSIVWILAGLASLIIGEMLYPEANKTISDIGAAWLGISVAAGYSYFGLNT